MTMDSPLRRWRRDKRNWTLDRLADELGISKSTLSRIETGRQDPDLSFIRQIIALSEGALTADDFVNQE